jgi:hypothetical protein
MIKLRFPKSTLQLKERNHQIVINRFCVISNGSQHAPNIKLRIDWILDPSIIEKDELF